MLTCQREQNAQRKNTVRYYSMSNGLFRTVCALLSIKVSQAQSFSSSRDTVDISTARFNNMPVLDFKLSQRSECYMLSSG